MRRFMVFGLAAIFSIASFAVSTAAGASADSSPSVKIDYGTVWSKGRLAKASGYLDDTGSSARAVFKLWDRDRGGKCAYLRISTVSSSGGKVSKAFTKCGTDGYKKINYRISHLNDVKDIKIEVCRIGSHGGRPSKCTTATDRGIKSLTADIPTFWSTDHRAKLKGSVTLDDSGVHATGTLWDLDRHGKCSYLKISAPSAGDKASRSFKQCADAGSGNHRKISFRVHKQTEIVVKLCRISSDGGALSKCITWKSDLTSI